MTNPARTSVRQRIPWLSLAGIGFVVLLTLGNAAANMLPFHVPTTRELQHADQRATADARREHLAGLLAEGDRCRSAVAREIARGLVYDGRSARGFADDHARRCGADPVVRRWADAPVPRSSMRQ